MPLVLTCLSLPLHLSFRQNIHTHLVTHTLCYILSFSYSPPPLPLSLSLCLSSFSICPFLISNFSLFLLHSLSYCSSIFPLCVLLLLSISTLSPLLPHRALLPHPFSITYHLSMGPHLLTDTDIHPPTQSYSILPLPLLFSRSPFSHTHTCSDDWNKADI